MKEWDFDQIISRTGTDCIKYDKIKDFLGFDDVLPMWVADMDFETPSFIRDAIGRRVEHPILGYSFRPDSHHEAIVAWMMKRHQWEIQSKDIAFSPGVVPGIYLCIKAFTHPGDEIIIQPPVYFPFFSTVEQNDRKLVLNPLINNDLHYEMDFEDLRKKITPKTKMIIISNPHNPVGRSWTKEELAELVEICYDNHLILLSDEIHSDLVFRPNRHQPVLALGDKAKAVTVCLMAPSKTFNLAGLSSSFFIASSEELMKKYQHALEATHLGLGNIFGNAATEAAYREGESWLESLLEYLSGNIDLMENFVRQHEGSLRMLRPESTYLLWMDFSGMRLSGEELQDLLFKEARIGVNPGVMFGPGGEGFMRFNVAMPRQLIREGLERLDGAIIRKRK